MTPPSQLWMKSHQWAFLRNHLAMEGSMLEARLDHFFYLSWLPLPPHILAGGAWCLPLPAALPWLCATEKGQSSEAWSIHPTCGCGWVLPVHRGGAGNMLSHV